MNDFFKAIGIFTVAIITAVLIALLMSWPTYVLWNLCLVGAVDGVRHITWLQSFGILVLCNILFKSSTNKKD